MNQRSIKTSVYIMLDPHDFIEEWVGGCDLIVWKVLLKRAVFHLLPGVGILSSLYKLVPTSSYQITLRLQSMVLADCTVQLWGIDHVGLGTEERHRLCSHISLAEQLMLQDLYLTVNWHELPLPHKLHLALGPQNHAKWRVLQPKILGYNP